MVNVVDIIKSINDEENLNIATTNPSLFYGASYNIEKIEGEFNYKRFFHFIVIDKDEDIKKLFRALRNGGYLITKIYYDEDMLLDTGFSAISKIDEWQIIKKVHSWNDWWYVIIFKIQRNYNEKTDIN